MSKQLIHIVESSARHQWFEDLVAELQANKALQAVVTLNSQGNLVGEFEGKGIPVVGGKKISKWPNIVVAVISLKRISKKADRSLAIAQGHLPSISAWISCLLFKTEYGIIHHQSPLVFFDHYRARYPFKGAVQRFFYIQYVKKAKFIQALSLEVYNSLLSIRYPESQLILIGHGIKMNQFENRSQVVNTKQSTENVYPTILMIGRLAWEKNYLFSFQVIAQLVKKQPGLRVIIAGTGPDHDDLVGAIADLKLTKHIELLGWRPDISVLMGEADILLHLSITESYGQVLLEACVSELHVFAFPVGIAQDLNQTSNPFMHLLMERSPEAIAESLSAFLSEQSKNSLNQNLDRSVYAAQDIHYVHKAMTRYLLEK